MNEGWKGPVYWNENKTKIESRHLNNQKPTRFYLDVSFQGVKRLFVLAFDSTSVANNPINNTKYKAVRDSHMKYFLSRVNITNYNALIDGRNVCDQPINDQTKKYDEIRKTATGQGDNYTVGCLLDYQSFRDHINSPQLVFASKKK